MLSSDTTVVIALTLTTAAFFAAWLYNILELLDILAIVCIPPVVVYEVSRILCWLRRWIRWIGTALGGSNHVPE